MKLNIYNNADPTIRFIRTLVPNEDIMYKLVKNLFGDCYLHINISDDCTFSLKMTPDMIEDLDDIMRYIDNYIGCERIDGLETNVLVMDDGLYIARVFYRGTDKMCDTLFIHTGSDSEYSIETNALTPYTKEIQNLFAIKI